jgi:hypothetical protein
MSGSDPGGDENKNPGALRTKNGGEGGIRTPGTLACTLDFESSTFNHSDTSPARAAISYSEKIFGATRRTRWRGSRQLQSDGVAVRGG